MPEPGKQFEGIKVEQVKAREYPGMTVHQGRVAEGQTGYRMVHEKEFDPRINGGRNYEIEGYRSHGRANVGAEKHSRGVTMFSSAPLPKEDMERHGATHQIEVDLSGLPFRSLRAPDENGVHHADVGLGLGVVGEMKWDRIKRITTKDGEDYHPEPGAGNPGEALEALTHMDTGARMGQRGR